MKLVDLETLKTMPNGTLFCISDEYGNPESPLSIVTGRYSNAPGWNGELQILPSMADYPDCLPALEKGENVNAVWEIDDSSDIDYKEDTMFLVFHKKEIEKMIRALTYALNYPNGDLDQDEVIEEGEW